MRKIILLFLIPTSCLAQTNYSIKDLKAGKFIGDTSYVYSLPFEKNKKIFLIQAYDSKMSHKGEFALDFKVKEGTKVCAARKGTVTALRKDSDKGGLKQENLSDGNFVIIRHDDGSSAMYWHLQKDGVFVNMGDTVKNGQVIALTGNTGYSAFPHLHFEVQGFNAQGNYRQLPTRFQTSKGARYLRPGKFYKIR